MAEQGWGDGRFDSCIGRCLNGQDGKGAVALSQSIIIPEGKPSYQKQRAFQAVTGSGSGAPPGNLVRIG